MTIDRPEPKPEQLRKRVLVADDDADAVQILVDFLEAKGFEVVAAMEGQEALARFYDDGPFDVAILDAMMPGIDGLELCRRIKGSPSGQFTPVLMLSARSDTRSRVAGLYGGADDYLSKPVDLRELAARLQAALRVRTRYLTLAVRRENALDAALTDGLTGGVNQPYFMRRLAVEIERCDRYSIPLTLLVADLMGLPEPEGDEDLDASLDSSDLIFAGPAFKLLEAAGKAIRSQLRSHDLMSRLRRSRFAIMLPHTDRKDLSGAEGRIQEAVAAVTIDPDRADDRSAGLSLRIGNAQLKSGMDAVTLLARAEPR